MKSPKRGRPPIGRKAMTAAQRQAKRRQRLREAEASRLRQQGQEPPRRAYEPPHGYQKAKDQLIAQGHKFQRAQREFGFEEGVFVDGAFLSTSNVITLAGLPLAERQQLLAEHRRTGKDFACWAVTTYMKQMKVSLDELIKHFEEKEKEQAKRMEASLLRIRDKVQR